MKLAAYMEAEGLDDAAMAARIGPDVSPWAVRKWRYGQRIPRLAMLKRISEVTAGAVTAQDHFEAAAQPRESAPDASARAASPTDEANALAQEVPMSVGCRANGGFRPNATGTQSR